MVDDDVASLNDNRPALGLDRRRFLSGAALGASVLLAGSDPFRSAWAASPADRGLVVVTTPMGNIGGKVLANLLTTSAKVRVIERDPSRIPVSIRDRVEVIEGSHGDAATANRAFEGAETVFWVCPPNMRSDSVTEAYVGFTEPACEAFRAQGVRRVVGISALGRGTPMAERAGFVTASLAMDDAIADTGVAYRALTMPSFMDNLLRQADTIKAEGVFYSPIDGDRKMPSVATRDIATVAARLLLDPNWTDGRESVAVLGPEDISSNDIARIMSQVLEKDVRLQQVGFDAYKASMVENGMSDAMAQGMADMARAKNDGLDNAVVRTAGNSTPTTFRRWCVEELKPAVLG